MVYYNLPVEAEVMRVKPLGSFLIVNNKILYEYEEYS